MHVPKKCLPRARGSPWRRASSNLPWGVLFICATHAKPSGWENRPRTLFAERFSITPSREKNRSQSSSDISSQNVFSLHFATTLASIVDLSVVSRAGWKIYFPVMLALLTLPGFSQSLQKEPQTLRGQQQRVLALVVRFHLASPAKLEPTQRRFHRFLKREKLKSFARSSHCPSRVRADHNKTSSFVVGNEQTSVMKPCQAALVSTSRLCSLARWTSASSSAFWVARISK